MTKARQLADLGNAYDDGALSNRNRVTNGSMAVAQRGISSTTDGYNTVDRFKMSNAGNDEAPTASQQVLTSSDTGVWEKGFRYSYRLTNGNQTSGAQANDRITLQHIIEAQDIASMGWNYASSSSYITLSFWCKSSVAQNFYARLQTSDGTSQGFAFETGALSANTWTKVTQIISGDSNLQFDNNVDTGLVIEWVMYRGTDKTGSMTLNSWGAFDGAVRVPDMTSTWYTTNDATFEITGVQLEVGDTVTPFEHRSYGDELAKCQRYYTQIGPGDSRIIGYGFAWNSTEVNVEADLPQVLRASPTVTFSNNSADFSFAPYNCNFDTFTSSQFWSSEVGNRINLYKSGGLSVSLTQGQSGYVRLMNSTSKIQFDSEL